MEVSLSKFMFKTPKKQRERSRRYQQKRREDSAYNKKHSEYYKKWYARNGRKRKEDYGEVVKNWIIHHPKEVNASRILRKAIEKGKIIKPLFCSSCDKKTKLVGHHEEYDKPLEVIWLCQSCHKIVHAKNKLAR